LGIFPDNLISIFRIGFEIFDRISYPEKYSKIKLLIWH